MRETENISDEEIQEEFQDVIENLLEIKCYKNKKAVVDIIKLILAFGVDRINHGLIEDIILRTRSYQEQRKTNYTIIKEFLNEYNIPHNFNKFSPVGNNPNYYDPYTGNPTEEGYINSEISDYFGGYLAEYPYEKDKDSYIVYSDEIQLPESSGIRTTEIREKYFSNFSKSK